MTASARPRRTPPGRPLGPPIAVVGACGGCGASSLAAALAVASSRARPTALVDLDRCGGGIDVALGTESVPGARWPDLAAARGDVDPAELVASLPRWRRVPVLSADRRVAPPGIVPDVLRALGASHRLVLDTAPEQLGELPVGAHVVLVVPRSVSGLAGAGAVRSLAQAAAPVGPARAAQEPWWVVARDVPRAELRPDDLADALGVTVAARLRRDRRTAAAVERGEGPRVARGTTLHAAARAVLGAVDGLDDA